MSASLPEKSDLAARLAHLERRINVEEALERVRVRTMAMHHSGELADVAVQVFEQLYQLGINAQRAGCCIVDPEKREFDYWGIGAGDDGLRMNTRGRLDPDSHRVLTRVWEAWETQQPFYSYISEGEELKAYYKVIADSFKFPAPVLEAIYASQKKDCGYAAIFRQGFLYAIFTEPPTEEDGVVYQRFARVFEQTYTRFLDLKKAEEQAREAQIEAALERVRARAMAMHRSDELAPAAELLYQELKALGITSWSCGYVFLDEETGMSSVWNTEPDGTLFMGMWTAPSTEHPVLRDRYASWKRKEPLLRVEFEGEALIDLSRYIARYAPLTEEETLALIPERMVVYTANFSHGYLMVASKQLMAVEEEQVMVRFAKVFEQTYTRFLDLKKAEEQAREAQIEAALERVRARTMAMQKSDELAKISTLLFQQLMGLGLDPQLIETCGFGTFDENRPFATEWSTLPGGQAGPFGYAMMRIRRSKSCTRRGHKIKRFMLRTSAETNSSNIIIT